jgi:hypothetical protein
MTFVTLGGEAVRKFVNVRFTSERKEARASEVRKAIERDPAWS